MNDVKVIIYTTPTCPWCRKAKAYLNEKGVNFKEIDVSKDQKAAEELVRKTHQMGVPVIQIGNEYVIGFDKKRIDKLLGIN
ncbi:MAG: glutaredoxin domain-containing protein [Defluviitoga tunisiensis]|jgi:glutaredoxin 3|uniref:Glutaredoxin-like protein n=1 Tax=Defluviitoga tunisiensis TaxID=1006576 RepID=A0A0C7P571_DEFTU|nr:glutaredoxin domain-containing protein [Defluviitoga tunisiensis]MDD3600876.1 glutaredoxin domain-containing protein [Defluviitoga tunisiensis]MDY0379910.1 glutaredoxin domain-containing protein [Defluviitoga tunisiensis]CEP78979.1 glutaredoxin-like protein [Defluviitoga tunisiensis]HHV01079.1 NrdH-redoxin [Defluviitoga tunisiensis]HOB55745.1 glutaredoxin domain-containing protein [Defluviitoga tunisiensis]